MPDPARLFMQRSRRGALHAPRRLGFSSATGDTSRVWATFTAGIKPRQAFPGRKFVGEGIVEFGSERVPELRGC